MKALIAAALAVSLAVPAAAQQRNCAPRDVVVERLQGGYSETRVTIAMGSQGRVVETFANLETGTWTVVITSPNGVACLVASGQQFEVVSEALPPQGDDA